ncbi:MAG: 2-keto-4-pentenoate hydratase [Alphaproteobacteria bacterium]
MIRRMAMLVAVALMATATPALAGEAEMAAALLAAEAAGRPIPMLSKAHPELDLAAAYRVQRAYVERRLEGDAIAGFKAGLTGTLGQLWFGVGEPLSGVLFASGRGGDGALIDLGDYRRLIVETEIAFVAGARIAAPIGDVAALRPLIRAVAPAIEMPEGGFTNPRGAKAVDLVAANVSAAVFLVGAERPASDFDLGGLAVTLTAGGREVSAGEGADVMGDPWAAALWLVNAAVARGWSVEPGHVLSTGVIGKRVEAEPGRYRADFGALGSLTFELR